VFYYEECGLKKKNQFHEGSHLLMSLKFEDVADLKAIFDTTVG
jgi:hypothetical protein